MEYRSEAEERAMHAAETELLLAKETIRELRERLDACGATRDVPWDQHPGTIALRDAIDALTRSGPCH